MKELMNKINDRLKNIDRLKDRLENIDISLDKPELEYSIKILELMKDKKDPLNIIMTDIKETLKPIKDKTILRHFKGLRNLKEVTLTLKEGKKLVKKLDKNKPKYINERLEYSGLYYNITSLLLKLFYNKYAELKHYLWKNL